MTGSAPAKKRRHSYLSLDTNGFVRRYDPVIDELLEVTDPGNARSQTDERRDPPKSGWSFQPPRWSSLNIWRTKCEGVDPLCCCPGWSDDDDSAHRLGIYP